MDGKTVSAAVQEADAVVFDLFHTLTSVDSVMAGGRATHEILGVTRDSWLEQVFGKSRERLIGKVKDPITMISEMARAIDPDVSDETIRAATENRLRRFTGALTLVPDSTTRVLAKLKAAGKKLGLVSNADAMEIAAWGDSPLARLMDFAAFSCELGYAKPEREIYEACIAELGVKAARTVYVGDGGSDELKGARALGMTTVMMTGVIRRLWPERIEPRLPDADFVVERLDELLGG